MGKLIKIEVDKVSKYFRSGLLHNNFNLEATTTKYLTARLTDANAAWKVTRMIRGYP